MSLLPQHKKSAAEITHLRATLGIPEIQPDDTPSPDITPTTDITLSPDITPTPVVRGPKRIHTLRKSATPPLAPAPRDIPAVSSKLPNRRHNDDEINAIRRREALALLTPVVNPKLSAAHPALLIPGYLTALAGTAPFFFHPVPITIPASCVACSLLVAAFIARRKTLSLHHAAFIAVISLFVIVFAALHYYPQLGHAT